MSVQRSAATLTAWDADLDAVLRQHANGGAVQFREGHAADAADEERHPPALSALGRKYLPQIAEGEIAFDARRQRVQLSDAEKLQQSGSARQALQAGALIEAHELRMSRKPAERRQHLAVEMFANVRCSQGRR